MTRCGVTGVLAPTSASGGDTSGGGSAVAWWQAPRKPHNPCTEPSHNIAGSGVVYHYQVQRYKYLDLIFRSKISPPILYMLVSKR